MTKKMLLLFAMWTLHLQAMAVDLPAVLNFDGQLLDSTDTPITTMSTVVFEIYDPSGNCLLYNETQSITPGADGSFTTKIGPSTGNASSADDGNLSWNVIFQNEGQVRAANAFCPGGYTPAAHQGRNLRVTVNGTVLTPDYSLSPVPMATVAETLQGKGVSDFLLSAPTSGTSTVDAHLRIANNQQLQLGSGDPSINYVNIVAPGALAASYVLTLPGDDGTAGQVLQTDGNGVLSWVANGGGGGTVTSVAAGSGLTGGPITTSGTLSIATGGVTNTHLATGIDASKLTVGTVPSAAITGITSGQIADGTIATVDISASSINSSHVIDGTIVDADISSLSASKLIGGGCAANQILKWNGSTWACSIDASGATVGSAAGETITSDNIPNCLNNQKLQMSPGPTYSWSCIDDSTLFPSGAGAGQAGQMNFRELAAFGTNTVTIRSPDSLVANFIFTLPGDDGTNGQVLSTDGNGVLSWIAAGIPPADSVNFTELADALVLDASTDISATGTNALSITNDGTGPSFRVNDVAGDTTPFIIDANGKVGIGTTSPDASLHIERTDMTTLGLEIRGPQQNGYMTLIQTDTSPADAARVILKRSNNTSATTSATKLGEIEFYSFDGTIFGKSASVVATTTEPTTTNSNRGAEMSFWTTANATASAVERMKISQQGFVGIGTTSPSARLDINNTSPGVNAVRVRTSATSTTAVMIDTTTSTAPALDVLVQGTSKMFVNNNGIGVGTTTPEAPLHISSFMKLQPQAGAPVACGGGSTGIVAYNGTANLLCVCNGTAWRQTDGTSACGIW